VGCCSYSHAVDQRCGVREALAINATRQYSILGASFHPSFGISYFRVHGHRNHLKSATCSVRQWHHGNGCSPMGNDEHRIVTLLLGFRVRGNINVILYLCSIALASNKKK
jgi:hypothetical protein